MHLCTLEPAKPLAISTIAPLSSYNLRRFSMPFKSLSEPGGFRADTRNLEVRRAIALE